MINNMNVFMICNTDHSSTDVTGYQIQHSRGNILFMSLCIGYAFCIHESLLFIVYKMMVVVKHNIIMSIAACVL